MVGLSEEVIESIRETDRFEDMLVEMKPRIEKRIASLSKRLLEMPLAPFRKIEHYKAMLRINYIMLDTCIKIKRWREING
jgi:hypothetical protein